MSKSTSTDSVVLAAIGALVVYEGYTLFNAKPKDTISERVWKVSARRPLIPFLLGGLVAHFVWQSQDVYDRYRSEQE